MQREIYEKLLDWNKNENHKPLMILGARQVGKTYIIDKFARENYKNYYMINLFERTDILEIYQSNINSEEKYQKLKILLDFEVFLLLLLCYLKVIQNHPYILHNILFLIFL